MTCVVEMFTAPLAPLLTDYSVPELGMFVLRPPGAFPARKVRVLIDILLEYFGDSASR